MSLIYSYIDRKVLFKLAEKYNKSNILGEYKFLLNSDWYSEKQLKSYQNEQIHKLVKHCVENVPYYTKLFADFGLIPNDITSRQDLVKLPILTKQDIRDNYDQFISKDVDLRKTKMHSTGGSTGVPLQFKTDINTWNMAWASTFRAWKWYGFYLGEKIFTIGGNSLVSKQKITTKDVFEKYLMRNFKFHSSQMKQSDMKIFYDSFVKVKPKAVRGYGSTLYVFAKYIKENKLPIPQIKVILTTGEVLLPEYRMLLQEVFKAPLYDNYGAGDGGIASHECYMHEGLHITEERCAIEVCDKHGDLLNDGDIGHVITTDLFNYAFPFIRYQVGDMSYIKKEKCSCGRKSRLFGEILGRNGKLLYSKEGVPISPTMLPIMLYPELNYHKKEYQELYNKIDRFQIQQDKLGDIKILLKMKQRNDENSKNYSYIIENYKNYFSGSKCKLYFVNEIKPLPSGKEDYVISNYQHDI